MTIDPAYTRFRSALTAEIAEMVIWWAKNYPGRRIDPEVLTGLCGRDFPRNRKGQTWLDLDERMWALGRGQAMGRKS